MKIYSKKGDDGTTALIGGVRVSKHYIRVDCYGTLDELNSSIGLIRSQIVDTTEVDVLAEIQDVLFTMGSYLASAPNSKMKLPELTESEINILELEIDRMTSKLPELKNFILPGASAIGAQTHIARCICRRAERMVVYLSEKEEVHSFIVPYINRLSDYLFTLARFLDMQNGGKEITWRPKK